MTDAGSDPVETYRTADLRLRHLLLGDGVDTPGLVKGEDLRLRVIGDLRHMRDAFNAAVADGEHVAVEKTETRVAELEEELRMIASARSRTQHQTLSRSETSALMTPAEAAQTLRVSKSSIYRAVRNGEIRAVRLTQKRGAIRIPTSELQRLSAAR
jgi:excisionase family DNA binding protein